MIGSGKPLLLREIKEIHHLYKQTKEDKMKHTTTCGSDKRSKHSSEWKWRKTPPTAFHQLVWIVFLLCWGDMNYLGGGKSVSYVQGFSSTYNPKDFSRNVTQLIDGLLDKRLYDKNIRPGFGDDRPLTILVNMNVRSMGPFSEKQQEYAMQVYLRQVWYDSRLRFNKTDIGRSTFSMNWMFAERIWTPDTFFINGKNSYAHAITAPNMFVRLQHDGQLYMSMRLTVRASCIMHLRKFPLDTQSCPLRIASYSYNAEDLIYRWDPTKNDKPVSVDEIELASYQLVETLTEEATLPVRRTEEISTLTINFHLRRLTGFFLLQVYVPCILIVCSSWVGFWITKKDAPGRVCLGVTTVLATVTLGFGDRKSFPEVSYATALDYFVILCLVFVFAAVIEFACINFLERRANKRRKKMEEHKKELANPQPPEGAGCIKVVPSLHTFLLETFKVHLTASPVVVDAAYTLKPKADTKGKLIQALKVPLSVVPNAATEASEKKIRIQLGPVEPEPEHHHTRRLSEIVSMPHTPKILQRLSGLHSRTSHDESESRTSSPPISPPGSPQPSIQASPLPSRSFPPLPPIPAGSPTTSQESPSQETPQISPRISPLTSDPASPPHTQATSVPTSSTSEASLGSSVESKQGTSSDPTKQPPTGSPDKQGESKKPEGTVIKVDSDPDPPPPPPAKKPEDITIWELLLRKNYLMKNMTIDFELPNEEDLLDRFSIIDLYSRRIFPSFFFLLFTIYWVLFNYYIADEYEKEGFDRPSSDGLVN